MAELDEISNAADPDVMWQGDEIDAEAQPPEELLAVDNSANVCASAWRVWRTRRTRFDPAMGGAAGRG